MKMRSRRGVTAIEYSLLLAVVVAGIVGAQIYLKRAISGRWRQAADTFGYGRQYDPKDDPSYTGPKFSLWGDKIK